MAGPVDFARSSHSTRALVDRRVTDASNPKDLQAGLTVEQVQFVKAYVVDALLVGGIEPPLLLSGSDAFTHRGCSPNQQRLGHRSDAASGVRCNVDLRRERNP